MIRLKSMAAQSTAFIIQNIEPNRVLVHSPSSINIGWFTGEPFQLIFPRMLIYVSLFTGNSIVRMLINFEGKVFCTYIQSHINLAQTERFITYDTFQMRKNCRHTRFQNF